MIGGIVLAALVGTVLPYAINIASFVGLRLYRHDVTPTFHAPGGLFTAVVAFGFLMLLAVSLSVDYPLIAALTVAALLTGFVVQYIVGETTATYDYSNAE